MALIPEDYFKCVLALGREPASEWVATCFLCSKRIGDKRYHFLVTNKHVFENESELYFRLFNRNDKEYKGLRLPLKDNNGKMLYSSHQSEDVAAITLAGGYLDDRGYEWIGFDVDENMISSVDYYKAGGSVGARVFMLGFPMGLVDINKNDPICRGGYIARENNNGYLLDIQNFPGNSGSPIISCPETVTLKNTKPLTKSLLIGIVSSYIPYRKQLRDLQTKEIVEVRDENSGLANACNVEVIREVIDMELKRFGIGELKNEGNSPNSSLPQ